MRRQPERAIQWRIVGLLRSVGCSVWVLGTTRRSGDYPGTMQTAGLPDLIAFLPRAQGVLFVEAKAPGGRLRPAQADFRACCLPLVADRVYHVTGGLEAVVGILAKLGIVLDRFGSTLASLERP